MVRNQREESESPPLPPFEFMSRNRRAVFGDPPSPYLAALLASAERRQRRKREQERLEKERKQNNEELSRKRRDPNELPEYLTPAGHDHLAWSGSGTSSSSPYPVSGTSRSQFADSESNGEPGEKGDNTSTDQTHDETKNMEEDRDEAEEDREDDEEDEGDEDSQEEQEDNGSEESEEGDGNGDDESQNGSREESEDDSADMDYDNDMSDDGNTLSQKDTPSKSEATVTDEEDKDEDSSQVCDPDPENEILVNKELCVPSPIAVDEDSNNNNNNRRGCTLIPPQSWPTRSKQTQHDHPRNPCSVTSDRPDPSSNTFSVPGQIFVDPVDFDNDETRALIHNFAAAWANLAVGYVIPHSENTRPAGRRVRSVAPRQVRDRYSPVSQTQGGFHAGIPENELLPSLSALLPGGSMLPTYRNSNVTARVNQDDPLFEETGTVARRNSNGFPENGDQNMDW
ncbi:hypothetical protein PAAG_05779 [Paracoccidioides lutzii Pb01]|uniref:Uncharacterized protein n=1 Tax=Paracoccidioides lutzii (strain ATCC MYA-826 / Pb01) TaxID=502779 RepID=C1H4T9_PARBA|nr:hypothetical protein PAAG_05779 [Paracoccidioides lutzii Pb01]EEH34733.2 hypothetical protein PAAG_05779 [Paracoccidioides lutzii Pb01]